MPFFVGRSEGTEVYVGIEVHEREAVDYFDYVGVRARDMTEPMAKAMIEIVLPGIEEQFDTQGARSGGWEPLTPKWAAYKAKHAKYQTILMFDDDPLNVERPSGLRHFATDPANAIVTPDSASWEIDYDIARYHQDGEGPNKKREIVVFTEGDEMELDHIFRNWLDGLLTSKRHSFRWSRSDFEGMPWSPTGPGPGRFRSKPL